MKKLTLVFDLDGTLVDTAPDLAAATNYALGTLDAAPLAEAEIRPHVSFGARGMIAHALETSGIDASDEIFTSLIGHFLEYYTDNIDRESRAYEGVEDLLEKHFRVGTRLCVCTNKREGLSRRLLKALSLDRYFHALTGSDTLPIHKPDPAHLIGTVIMAQGNLDRTIMVGDSKTDVDTARAAGIPVIGVNFGYTDVPMAALEPDALIDHYREFDGALKIIADARKATGIEY